MDIDYNIFRGLYTGFLLILFVGIFAWAYSKKRKKSFDEAAHLIFDNDDTPIHKSGSGKHDA